jgi:hypothetical protein
MGSSSSSKILSVYSGRDLVGFLHVRHGKPGVEAYTSGNVLVGVFASVPAAANAISDAVELPITDTISTTVTTAAPSSSAQRWRTP